MLIEGSNGCINSALRTGRKEKERRSRLGSWAVGREQVAEIYEYIRSL